jgi:signal transduction histidine kinase
MASLQALVNQVRSSPLNEQLTTTELIDKVDHYSQRGLHFAEQFLRLAQVESDEEIQIYELDLYAVSQNAIDSLYHQAQEKSIELSLDAIDECWVMGNGDLLERIILNLVSNAIKYSPNNSQVVVSISMLDVSSQLEVRVSDQGPGIPLELISSLFKPYSRGVDQNTQQAKGVGLGLRFVDVALKRLKSKIQFDSSKNGASFYFYLTKIDL